MLEHQIRLHESSRLPNEALIAAAKRGESSAVEERFSRYRNQVLGVVHRRAENADEAEDIVQETMLRAFVNIGRFRGDARFSSWFIAIATNVSISMKRKVSISRQSREVSHDLLGRAQRVYLDDPNCLNGRYDSWILTDSDPTPEQCYVHKERYELLQQNLLQLHPKYSVILRAWIFNESSIKQTAQSSGVTCATLKSRLRRARQMLLKMPLHTSRTKR